VGIAVADVAVLSADVAGRRFGGRVEIVLMCLLTQATSCSRLLAPQR
jgi:hypothetical protein